jgi:hypothetical protein
MAARHVQPSRLMVGTARPYDDATGENVRSPLDPDHSPHGPSQKSNAKALSTYIGRANIATKLDLNADRVPTLRRSFTMS